MLARTDDGHHVGMAGVVHRAEVWVIDLVDDTQDLRGFVEGEPRFELPGKINPQVSSLGGATFPGLDYALPRRFRIHFGEDGWRLNRVDPEGLDSQIMRELEALAKSFKVGRVVVGIDKFLTPKIGGDAGEIQTGVLHGLKNLLASLRRRCVVRVGMGIEGSEFQPIEFQTAKLPDNFIKGNRLVFVWSDGIRPSSDRDLFHLALS